MPDFTIGRLRGGFCVSWTESGRRRRYQLQARSRKEAEAEALDVIRRETLPVGGLTVSKIWSAYRQDHDGRAIAETMRHEEKSVLGFFGAMRPDQVTTDHCREYTAQRRAAGRKDGTIWTELGHLRTALSWAQKRKMIASAPHIERPPKPAPKDRWLTTPEIRELIDGADAPHIRLFIILMLATAARPTAVLELTWDRVDMERGIINLRTDDTGPRKGRAIVPINAGALSELRVAQEASISDHVIEWGGEGVRSVKKGFAAAALRAGLKDVTPHCLRHTAAVHLAVSGVKMSRIAQYLGHSNSATTEAVYARFAPDHLREEADILDFVSVQEPKEHSVDSA
ncbi:MAG: integrase [Rhodovulum sulfidophilum]|uniref:Integrase n=1 Tax=Rhodovulum sulfidophilum TaxID=35806 RepID=A0A2W5Q4U5_RHOSU|nr:MAG: integrase [Rhodovulum sulfidophilum]